MALAVVALLLLVLFSAEGATENCNGKVELTAENFRVLLQMLLQLKVWALRRIKTSTFTLLRVLDQSLCVSSPTIQQRPGRLFTIYDMPHFTVSVLPGYVSQIERFTYYVVLYKFYVPLQVSILGVYI